MPVEESSGALKQADRKRFPPAPGKQNQRRNIHEQYKENRTSVARLGHGNGIHAASRKKPDRTIRLSGKAVAAGVGFGWGKGTLTYKGEDYPISVKGLSLGKVGITGVTASGDFYH